MRIHSNTITRQDIEHAARKSRTVLLQCDPQTSRKRSSAFELTLGGLSKSRTVRFRDERAATYRQWGTFLAYLLELDPNMVAGNYDGLAGFDAATRYAFDAVPYTTQSDDRVAVIFRDSSTARVKG